MARVFNLSSLLTLDTKKFTASLSGAQKRFNKTAKSLQKTTKKMGSSFKNLGSDILKLTAGPMAALTLSFRQFSRTSEEVDKLSKTFGISVQAISQYQHALSIAGVEMDKWTGAIEEMQIRIAEGTSHDVLKSLGLDPDSLKRMKPEAAFERIIDGLANVRNSFDRTFLSDEIFGGDGLFMIRLLDLGSKGIQKLRREADDLNITLDKKTVQSMRDFNVSMTTVKASVLGIGKSITKALLPEVQNLTVWVLEVIKDVRAWIESNSDLFASLSEIGVGISGVGFLLVGAGQLSFAISSIIGLFGDLMKIGPGLKVFWATSFGPVGVLVGLVVALGFEINGIIKNGIGPLGKAFRGVLGEVIHFATLFFKHFALGVVGTVDILLFMLSKIPLIGGAFRSVGLVVHDVFMKISDDIDNQILSHKEWREEFSKQPTPPGGAAAPGAPTTTGQRRGPGSSREVQEAIALSRRLIGDINAPPVHRFTSPIEAMSARRPSNRPSAPSTPSAIPTPESGNGETVSVLKSILSAILEGNEINEDPTASVNALGIGSKLEPASPY